MPSVKYILTLILLFANVGKQFAFAEGYIISVLGNEELNCRFEDNRVNTIYKDSDGFIWIGTGETVERIGSHHSLVYHFAEKKSGIKPSPFLVNALLEVRKHEFWAGTIQGVWRMNHEKRSLERLFGDEISFSVQALDKDNDGNLYIATVNGLYIYDGKGLRHIVVDEKDVLSSHNLILDVLVSDPENVWLLTVDGLVLCDSNSGALKFYLCPPVLRGEMACLSRSGNEVYLGTKTGEIYIFDLQRRTYRPFWQGVHAPIAKLDCGDGVVGVATGGKGIFLLSQVGGEILFTATYDIETGKGLLSDMISSILLTDNEIWCGTNYYQGLNLLRKKSLAVRRYDKSRFDLQNVYVRSLLRTPQYTFVGTREGFYYVDEEKGSCVLMNVAKAGGKHLRSNLIFSFYGCGDEVWVGTCGGGLAVFNPRHGTFHDTPLTQVCVSNDIFMFDEDTQEGVLWLAASDGLYSYRRQTGEIKEYNASNSGMPGNIVYGFYMDSKGRFWLGTDKGLALFDRQTGRCTQAGLPAVCRDKAVRSIYEGRDGTLFFCMLDNRLMVADGALQHVRPINLMTCHSVAQDEDGFYWLGGSNGLLRIDEDLEQYQLISTMDGISVSPGAPILKDNKDDLWVCTPKGLFVVDPHCESASVKVRITEIKVNGEHYVDIYSLKQDSLFSFSADENTVTFKFLPLGYRELGKERYQYMLEGQDSVWVELNGENRITYFNLPSGKYRFRVRSLLNRDSEDSVIFCVQPKGTWMVYAVICSVVVICLLGGRFWVRRIRNERQSSPSVMSDAENRLVDTNESQISENSAKLSNEEVEEIVSALRKYMQEREAYLNVDLKQSEVAAAIGHPTYLLSTVFTRYLKMGYYDFVNSYRVERFKQSVSEGLHKKYTLVTLAEKCGFKSKASFFRAFKKFTGYTPNEYIQQYGTSDKNLPKD